MNKGVLMGVVILVLILVGGGWYLMRGNQTSPTSTVPTETENVPAEETSDSTPTPDAAATGNIVEVTVEGSGFKFVPAQIKVKKGDTVRLTFKNTGGIHDFVLDEFAVATNQIGDGEEEEVEFVANKSGSFEYYCSVGNHRAMGMKGTLVVE